jgi:hypothetical protein
MCLQRVARKQQLRQTHPMVARGGRNTHRQGASVAISEHEERGEKRTSKERSGDINGCRRELDASQCRVAQRRATHRTPRVRALPKRLNAHPNPVREEKRRATLVRALGCRSPGASSAQHRASSRASHTTQATQPRSDAKSRSVGAPGANDRMSPAPAVRAPQGCPPSTPQAHATTQRVSE